MRPILLSLAAFLALAGSTRAIAQATGLDRPATIPPTGNAVAKPQIDNITPAPLTDPNASKPGGSHVEGTTTGTSRGGTDKVPDGSPEQLNAPRAH